MKLGWSYPREHAGRGRDRRFIKGQGADLESVDFYILLRRKIFFTKNNSVTMRTKILANI